MPGYFSFYTLLSTENHVLQQKKNSSMVEVQAGNRQINYLPTQPTISRLLMFGIWVWT